MNKTKLEEIVFDEDINTFSQFNLARWMMTSKKHIYNNNDIKIKIAENVELDTIGCNNEQDIIDKYQSLFEQIGLPNYEIRKIDNNYININIDSFGSLSTKNCHTIENFITANRDKLDRLPVEEKNKFIEIASQYIENQKITANEQNQTESQNTQDKTIVSVPDVSHTDTMIATPPTSEENNEVNEIQTRILDIDNELAKINRNIKFLQLTSDGSINRTTKKESLSFEKRKEEINRQISELENVKENTTDIKELYNEAHNEIAKYQIDESILEAYNSATEVPDSNRITKALEEAFKLPQNDLSRIVLIDAIEKLNFRYNGNDYNNVSLIDNKNTLARIKDNKQDTFTEVEKAVLAQYDGLNQNSSQNEIISVLESVVNLPKTSEIKKPLLDIVQSINKSVIENGNVKNDISKQKILELRAEYESVENEQQNILNVVSPLLIKAQEKQAKLIEERENLKKQINNELSETKETSSKELDLTFVNMAQNRDKNDNNIEKTKRKVSVPGFRNYDLKEGQQSEKDNSDKELDLTFANMVTNPETKEISENSPLYQAVMSLVKETDKNNENNVEENHMIEKEENQATNAIESNTIETSEIDKTAEHELLMAKYKELIEQGYRPDHAERIARSIIAIEKNNKQDNVETNTEVVSNQEVSEVLTSEQQQNNESTASNTETNTETISNQEVSEVLTSEQQQNNESTASNTETNTEAISNQEVSEVLTSEQQQNNESTTSNTEKPIVAATTNDSNNVSSKPVDKEQSNEDFIAKLESMDRISTDLERRLSKEDSWMEVNTANYFGKLDENEQNAKADEKGKAEAKDEKPHKITEIKKAGKKLLDKIKESKFVEKIKHALEICKKNKDAIVFTTAFVGMAIVGGLINSNDNTPAPIVPDTTIETNTDKDLDQDNNYNDTKIETGSVTVEIENPSIEETEANTLADSVANVKESILAGSEVYSNVVDANQETNGLLPTDQQLENSWSNSEVGAYYTLNDNGIEQLSNEEAKVAFNDGEQVIARLDNQNTPIGFVPLETSEKGISR